MPRTSAFRGTFTPNARPYVVVAPDCYVSIQGETTVIACGECKRKIDINAYVTGISTEASVDSPPGSATINLSIPDNDKNDFFSDGEFLIIPMMEIEIFAKGYFLVGGVPQYYRIFWGMVSSVTKTWSNGVSSITLNCKDILRWWEVTTVNVNPAFLDSSLSTSGWQFWANKFAGANPYTVIIALAKDAMGDMSLTTGSFNQSVLPEKGPEGPVIASYAKDIMAYWQLKFGNIWTSLVCYGSSGQAYTFTGDTATVSPVKISSQIFDQEAKNLNLNPLTSQFRVDPKEVHAFKIDLNRAAETNFFQSEMQSKLSIAMTVKEQAGFEFYCDTTGDIIFKPPFYNLNVLPNKPVSWIQDFEVMDDSVTDSEAEVFTHVTSSGNAFSGSAGIDDFGLNDDVTTPRTGVIDYHLLRRYGWRRLDMHCEWSGNGRKLFYHLLDYIDKVNSKRKNGTVTIPMRPELRMGFPIWFPKYDSFFYIQGISHNFTPGGTATTTLTLTAKRSKFIAPKNIGSIDKTGTRTVPGPKSPKTGQPKSNLTQPTFTVTFPSGVGETVNNTGQSNDQSGGPAIIRHPKTGKLLGYPNAVMVYRKTVSDKVLAVAQQKVGSTTANQPTKQAQNPLAAANLQSDILKMIANGQRAQLIDRLRLHRYEAGFSNAGLYDYAHDEKGYFKEFAVVASDSITWGSGTDGGPDAVVGAVSIDDQKAREAAINADIKAATNALKPLTTDLAAKQKAYADASKAALKDPKSKDLATIATTKKSELATAQKAVDDQRKQIALIKANSGANIAKLPPINVFVRPVSDEFGFELIGHYRYGRGAFIDRGKVTIQDPQTSSTANQINIQFAPTSGLLTSTPTTSIGPESKSFDKAFNEMQPEDYVTGGSFKGGNYPNGVVDPGQINYTSQATYTNAINSTVTKTSNGETTTTTSTGVYAEADATSRAKLLADLSPTMANGLDSQQGNACACSIGNTNWLSVLPQSFLDQILGPVQKNVQIPDPSIQAGQPEGSILVATGINQTLPDPSGFFNILHQYLSQRFDQDYQQNLLREQFASNGGRAPIDFSAEDAAGGFSSPGNLLGNPIQGLFERAVGGDPDALAALNATTTVDTAKAQAAMDQFNQRLDTINQQADAAFSGIAAGVSSSTFIPVSGTVGPGQKFQPPAGGPSLSSVLNPKRLPSDGIGTQSGRDPPG